MVKAIKTDNGTEYINDDLEAWLDNKGIVHLKSAPYCPQQNGTAERAVGVISNIARTLLVESKLPEYLWAEACKTAAYANNRLFGPKSDSQTRFELFFGYKPDVSNMKIFGQSAVVRFEPESSGKFAPKGKVMRFVGYMDSFNTFRFFDGKKIVVSCNAKFLSSELQVQEVEEKKFETSYAVRSIDLPEKVSWCPTLTSSIEESPVIQEPQESSSINSGGENQSNEESIDEEMDENLEESEHLENNTNNENLSQGYVEHGPRTINEAIHAEIHDRNSNESPSQIPRLTRSTAGSAPIFRSLPYEGRSFIAAAASMPNNTSFSLDDEPNTLAEAKMRSDWPQWRKAVEEEFESLKKNQTFQQIDRPSNARIIGSRWVFRIKRKGDNTIDRYKARLVARGYSQIEGVDFKETYAPVASMLTVRLFLALVVQLGLKYVQFDVKTAFLNGDLSENILMELPEKMLPNKVWQLKRSIYGLKQSPRNWNQKFCSFLTEFGLKVSKSDRCFYYNDEREIYIIIYVDDALAAAESSNDLEDLVKFLKENLEIVKLDGRSFLGFQIERDRDGNIFIHQEGFIRRALDRFRMSESNPTTTPMEAEVFDSSKSPTFSNVTFFKQLVGTLLYLSTCTRPDISFSVG